MKSLPEGRRLWIVTTMAPSELQLPVLVSAAATFHFQFLLLVALSISRTIWHFQNKAYYLKEEQRKYKRQ